VPGLEVCRFHGANTANARAAGQRRLAEAEATRQVATLGLPVDISPTEALLQEVQWTAGHVHWLRSKVQELDQQVTHILEPEDDDGERELFSRHPNHARHGLIWGTSKVTDKRSSDTTGIDTIETATPSVWYVLYAKERQHLVAVCAAALKAGVEQRRVALAESQGLLVSDAMRRILDAMLTALITAGMADSLRTVWAASVTAIVPRELRAIAGGDLT